MLTPCPVATTTTSKLYTLSTPRFDFVDRLRHANTTDPSLVAFCNEITAGNREAPWALVDGMVMFHSKLYVPPSSDLLLDVITDVHNDSHEGVQRTLHRLRRDFHAPITSVL